jgi:hypothetical protein
MACPKRSDILRKSYSQSTNVGLKMGKGLRANIERKGKGGAAEGSLASPESDLKTNLQNRQRTVRPFASL